MRRFAAAALAIVAACQTPPPRLDRPNPAGFDVLNYEVRLVPDLAAGRIESETRVVFRSEQDGLSHIGLTDPGPGMTVTGISDRRDGRLRIELPSPLDAGETGEVVIGFAGQPAYGLTFGAGSFHSEYFSCGWMACDIDAFGDKASLRLELVLPPALQSLGPGLAQPATASPDGRTVHVWHEARAFPAYTFAVAAGNWRQWITHADGVELKVLADAERPDDLPGLFASSPGILAFLTRKAGMAMPAPAYVQILVDGGSAQEASGHSIIGREMLPAAPMAPGEDWVIIHEMAHQWWGNSVTAASLTDFWLNEGIVTFLTAAWEEERWGRGAYIAELDRARARLDKAGSDVAALKLAHPGPWPSLGKRRAIQYGKGALFMDALRAELGDEVFWKAFADYTRTNAGRSVTSKDLEAAFEASSGRDLQAMFDAWVYPEDALKR